MGVKNMELVRPVDEKEKVQEKSNIKGDKVNMMILIFLYFLGGSFGGFLIALPIILQKKNVRYADQAEFTFVNYPLSFKILWAPLVDGIFFRKFGRRKTWVIPVQYLFGLTLLVTSINFEDWLSGDGSGRKPGIRSMTMILTFGTLFYSMQDIALDGWALTMLQKRNLGYAGTCQLIGLEVGRLLTSIIPILLDSKDACNIFRSIPQSHGFVNFADSMLVWSILIIISTTFILIFKKDDSLEIINDENCECKLGPKESYMQLWRIFKLGPMIMLSAILLTAWLGFGPFIGMSHLKIIENGVPRDKFVLFSVAAVPFKILFSVSLGRRLGGPQSLHYYVILYIIWLISGVMQAIILSFSPLMHDENGTLPIWYTGVLLLFHYAQTVLWSLKEISIVAFFWHISDPRHGGIYLALMNTMNNMGMTWPTTLCLWCVDFLKINTCRESLSQVQPIMNDWCIKVDGFFVETIVLAVIGVSWLYLVKKQIYKLEKLDHSHWRVEKIGNSISKDEQMTFIN